MVPFKIYKCVCFRKEQHASLTTDMATDYLTCGQCLREFPLQCITLFIQHKKLDCDDENDLQNENPGRCLNERVSVLRQILRRKDSNLSKLSLVIHFRHLIIFPEVMILKLKIIFSDLCCNGENTFVISFSKYVNSF